MYLSDVKNLPKTKDQKIGDLYIFPDGVKVVCHCPVKWKKLVACEWKSVVNGIEIDITKSHPDNIKKKFDALKEKIHWAVTVDE